MFLLMVLASSNSHQPLHQDWYPEPSVERRGCSRHGTEPGTWLRSLLITHALNISSDVIKASEIKCLSQAQSAGYGIQFGQDSGKQTQGEKIPWSQHQHTGVEELDTLTLQNKQMQACFLQNSQNRYDLRGMNFNSQFFSSQLKNSGLSFKMQLKHQLLWKYFPSCLKQQGHPSSINV